MAKLVIGCGYLGQRVAAKWTEAGETVFALTRSAERAEEFQSQGWQPIIGDVTETGLQTTLQNLPEWDSGAVCRGLRPRERFIPAGGLRWRVEKRVEALAGRVRRSSYIFPAPAFTARMQGEWIDETSPTEPTRPTARFAGTPNNSSRDFSRQKKEPSRTHPPTFCGWRGFMGRADCSDGWLICERANRSWAIRRVG